MSIILHNALLYLVFIYSNFYCHLPNDLSTFVADLGSMFRIFDMKVIAEFKLRMHTSFLEYVYKKRKSHILQQLKILQLEISKGDVRMNPIVKEDIMVEFSSLDYKLKTLDKRKISDEDVKDFQKMSEILMLTKFENSYSEIDHILYKNDKISS